MRVELRTVLMPGRFKGLLNNSWWFHYLLCIASTISTDIDVDTHVHTYARARACVQTHTHARTCAPQKTQMAQRTEHLQQWPVISMHLFRSTHTVLPICLMSRTSHIFGEFSFPCSSLVSHYTNIMQSADNTCADHMDGSFGAPSAHKWAGLHRSNVLYVSDKTCVIVILSSTSPYYSPCRPSKQQVMPTLNGISSKCHAAKAWALLNDARWMTLYAFRLIRWAQNSPF